MSERDDIIEFIDMETEALAPSGLLNHLDRYRPHDGQPHTDTGERGAQEVTVTLRDVYDCWLIGAFRASGLSPKDYPGSVYDLPWDDMDPIAVMQCASVVLERRAGLSTPPIMVGGVVHSVPPTACIWCNDDYPELCPPRLHEMGNQAFRESA